MTFATTKGRFPRHESTSLLAFFSAVFLSGFWGLHYLSFVLSFAAADKILGDAKIGKTPTATDISGETAISPAKSNDRDGFLPLFSLFTGLSNVPNKSISHETPLLSLHGGIVPATLALAATIAKSTIPNANRPNAASDFTPSIWH